MNQKKNGSLRFGECGWAIYVILLFSVLAGGLGALGMQSIAALNQIAGVANSTSAASGKSSSSPTDRVNLVPVLHRLTPVYVTGLIGAHKV